jgi:hypothetical protein
VNQADCDAEASAIAVAACVAVMSGLKQSSRTAARCKDDRVPTAKMMVFLIKNISNNPCIYVVFLCLTKLSFT